MKALCRKLALLSALSLSLGAASQAALAAAPPPDGTISQLDAQLPDYFYATYHDGKTAAGTPYDSLETQVISDPINQLLFEYDLADGCPPYGSGVPANLIEFDANTEKVLSAGCLPIQYRGSSYTAGIAVDPTDRIIFIADSFFGGAYTDNAASPATVIAYSEADLSRPLATWSLPADIAQATPDVYALSWSAKDDDLVLLATAGADPSTPLGLDNLPQVGVVTYRIRPPVLIGNLTPQPLWTASLTGTCQAPLLQTSWGAAAVGMSQDLQKAFVPCTLFNGYGTQVGVLGQRTGVATVHLARKDQGGTCRDSGAEAGALCPNGQISAAVAPALAEDFLFDPGADRGFMPCCAGAGSNVDLYVFDGIHEIFVGRTNVGTDLSYGLTDIALDPVTGRLYVFTPEHGLTVVDGRRTPVPTGDTFPSEAPSVFVPKNAITAVLPPTKAYPYARVVAPLGSAQGCPTSYACHLVSVLEYADRYPVSQDPPANADDSNTYNRSAPPGTVLQSTFTAAARGYGIHSDLVGGPQGVIQNWTLSSYDPSGLPFAHGQRDLFGGVVDITQLNGESASGQLATQGVASWLEPADRLTAAYYGYCTNGSTLYGNCTSPPCGAVATDVCQNPTSVVPATSPDPTSGLPTRTGQAWPVPQAACSQPSDAEPAEETAGVTVTSPRTADSQDAQLTTLPGSAEFGSAMVNCRASTPVTNTVTGVSGTGGDGTALKTGQDSLNMALGGALQIHIGAMTTTTSAEPPTGVHGVVSDTMAVLRDVTLSLPSTNGQPNEIVIGNLVHHATATAHGQSGTAVTTDTVSPSDVRLTVNGSTVVVCDKGGALTSGDGGSAGQSVPCGIDKVIQAINAVFPSFVSVMAPQADNSPPADQHLGNGTSNGTPGGFKAVVQSDVNQQYGDQKFNGMSPEEAAFLPAMRIVVYDDGGQGLTREVIDLAGVQDEATFGYLPPESSECSGCVPSGVDVVTAGQDAGLRASLTYIPGSDGGVRAPSAPSGGDPGYSSFAPLAVVQRVFSGIAWLVRSPMAALQMLALLALLGAPIVVMVRRRSWVDDLSRGETASE